LRVGRTTNGGSDLLLLGWELTRSVRTDADNHSAATSATTTTAAAVPPQDDRTTVDAASSASTTIPAFFRAAGVFANRGQLHLYRASRWGGLLQSYDCDGSQRRADCIACDQHERAEWRVNPGATIFPSPTCTIAPASLMPTVAGAAFTVTVKSGSAQTYNFNINGAGNDAAQVAHTATVVFNSLFTVTVSNSSGTQSVKAGQSATYSLVVTPRPITR
jgi:hypothetical protein